jgi:hypothetical protein
MTTSAVPYMMAESDTDRVNRSFLGFMSSALGVDNNYVGDDGVMRQATGQYITMNPLDGSYSVVGSPVSTLQQRGVAAGGGGLLLLLVLGFVLLKGHG